MTDVTSALDVTSFDPVFHYEVFASWWRNRGLKAPPLDALPTTGIVVLKNEKPLAMGFGYLSNSKVGVVGFIAADDKAGPRARVLATGTLVECLSAMLDSNGCRYKFSWSNWPGLSRIFQGHGFQKLTMHDFLGFGFELGNG